jgi:hypothetical protein
MLLSVALVTINALNLKFKQSCRLNASLIRNSIQKRISNEIQDSKQKVLISSTRYDRLPPKLFIKNLMKLDTKHINPPAIGKEIPDHKVKNHWSQREYSNFNKDACICTCSIMWLIFFNM